MRNKYREPFYLRVPILEKILGKDEVKTLIEKYMIADYKIPPYRRPPTESELDVYKLYRYGLPKMKAYELLGVQNKKGKKILLNCQSYVEDRNSGSPAITEQVVLGDALGGYETTS